MTGELAQLSPCPPFPDFTSLEAKVLEWLAGQFEGEEDAFRQQVACATVTDRINTAVGFYTRVSIDRTQCRPLPVRARGGHFEVEGIEHGMGVVLWNQDGYLETIEGYTYDEDALAGRDLADLQLVRFVHLG